MQGESLVFVSRVLGYSLGRAGGKAWGVERYKYGGKQKGILVSK
jgi:hypothetical protein